MARTQEEIQISIDAADHAISETRREMEQAGFSLLKIAKELNIIAFSDIKNHVTIDDGGAIQAVRLEDMGDHSRAVKKIEENTKITESKDGQLIWKDSRIKYELYDKLDALKFAAALMGMEQPKKGDITLHGEISALLREIDGKTTGPPKLRE